MIELLTNRFGKNPKNGDSPPNDNKLKRQDKFYCF